MRVLSLAPPSTRPGQLTAHSFIDEEILAIQQAGVSCVVLSDAIAQPEVRHGVHMIPVPPNPSIREIAATFTFAARHAITIPPEAIRTPRQIIHAVRIELAAARSIAAQPIDVVHSHFGWPAGFGGAIAATHAGVPLVASLRGMDLLSSPAVGYGLRLDTAYDAALRLLLRVSSRTLYATEYMRTLGVDAGAPLERAIVIRKGVDLARFHPAADRPSARKALGLSAPMILTVGSLSRRKGHDVVLDAVALLRRAAWTLVICGEGSERAALEARAAALGIGDRVRFVGTIPRDAIGSYFAAADVFVHAPFLEAAGNVVLEALAAGCPIVCTASGGPTEYVVGGQTGFLVQPGDRRAMADGIGTLLASAALRGGLSRAARQAAELHYPYRRMVNDYIAMYESVVAEGRARSETSSPCDATVTSTRYVA